MSRTADQRRLLELFDRLLDVPPAARTAWIEEHVGDDEALRSGLAALLAGHEEDSGPLDRSPVPPSSRQTYVTEDGEVLRGRLEAALGDRYEIESELGRGGMAIVFRARELKHDRPVVLKVLRPELLPLLGEDRFQREVRIASRLSHPNLIGLIDSGTADDLPFFVMPFVEGETLQARLDRAGPLSAVQAGNVLRDVAAGLAHAHELGIAHRDLKPANILCAGDHAYIMDFGIARAFSDEDAGDQLTRPGLALGTPRYMAPEQRAGRVADHRADIYAWGLLAREVTGEELPSGWVDVVSRCLEEDPERRPEDATDLVRAIEHHPAGRFSLASIAGRAWPWAAAAVALGLLAWGAAVRSGPDSEPAEAVGPAVAPTEPSLPFAVAPFRNDTDDPGNDMLGRLIADWIVQGLQQADVGPVVPWSTTRATARVLAETRAASGGDDELAEELAAGTVITGSIYEIGDHLSIAATVTDVRADRVIAAPPPISVSADSAEAAIRELRDRILGSLAIQRDPELSLLPGVLGSPPLLEAYRAYEQGERLFDQQDYEAASEEYARAFALDTTFLVAKLGEVRALWNRGHWAEVDSALVYLETRRDRLTEFDDLRRRSFEAQRAGDGERAYRLELRRAELGPTPLGSYNAASLAIELNRPGEAVEMLEALDPNGPGLRGWAQYWTQLAHGYHALGRYGDELDAAEEMWARFPERRIATVLAARALASRGSHAQLDSLLDSLRPLPTETYWSLGAALVVAGEELRAHHGDTERAARYLERAVDWLEARLAESPDERVHRYWLGAALYDLERFAEAERQFRTLWRDFPRRTTYRDAALIARAQTSGTASVAPDLGDDELVHGHQYAARARISAAGGDGDRALNLLTEGLRRGINGLAWLHATSLPDLGRYADDPRYVRVLGPTRPTRPPGD